MIEKEMWNVELSPQAQEAENNLPKQVIDLWVEIRNSKNGAKELRRWDLTPRNIQDIVDGKLPHPRIFEATINLQEEKKPPTKRGRKTHLDYGRFDSAFSGLVFCTGTTLFDRPRTTIMKDVTCSHCLNRIESQLRKMEDASDQAEKIISREWEKNKAKTSSLKNQT